MAATVAAIRGSLGDPTPQIFAQLTLANAVTKNKVFSHVAQSDFKQKKTGDDEIVLLSRASNFLVHCEGSNSQICLRLDDETTNTSFVTVPMGPRSQLTWTPASMVSPDAHLMLHANDGNVLAFVDPAHTANWFVGEWIPKQEEAAYKLADPGFRDAPNPPDGLRERSKKQSWTPWYTSPAPTPPQTPPASPSPYQERAPAPAERYVPGDGVAPSNPYAINEADRAARMEKNVTDIEREMNSLLYTPGQELAVLQKLQMLCSVEPKLLGRADMLSVLRRVLEKTADPGTARQAIVFANEFMHIDDVVLGANALGLYQLVELGLKPARAATDSVTRNKATETVKYILDRRGDLRQRPKVLQQMPQVDSESFLGKLGAVEQPLGTTIQEQLFNSKPLPVKSEEAEEVLRKLREELTRRGSNTMKMLGIRFKIMDDDGKGGISPSEFQSGMLEFNGTPVSNEATQSLFDYYAASGGPKDGQELNFDQFVIMMRGYLTPQRRALVHRAFRKMDRDGSGVVDWNDLKDVYNVAQHPKVLSGEFSEEMALTDVLSKYGDEHFRSNGDGKLSLAEFEQYYANVGANIDTDEYFELMMRQAWQI
jgi:Ca2+-binding EF-hand superfamily protein